MLKTKNYKVEKHGYIYPEVVALAYPNIYTNRIYFKIGVSREEVEKGNILETISMPYTFNRNEDAFTQAYNFAKMSYEDNAVNEETGKVERVTKYQPFYGWDNDIV